MKDHLLSMNYVWRYCLQVPWKLMKLLIQIKELTGNFLSSVAVLTISANNLNFFLRCNASGLSSYKLSNKAVLHINRDQEEALHVASPTFIAQPLPGTYIEGQNVSLDCAANGNPMPTITWLKDGYPIDMK